MKFQVKGEFQNLREKRGFQEGLMQIKKNPEIPGFCVSKSRGLRTGHKRVKKIETECFSVLLRRQQHGSIIFLCCSVTQTIARLSKRVWSTTLKNSRINTLNIRMVKFLRCRRPEALA